MAVAARTSHVTYKVVTLVAGILGVIFVSSLFFGGRGTAELQLSRKRVADLHADIRRLETENARLRADIESVKRSTYTVERIAREDLGMSKRGEIVYLIQKK
jgi:cell division protein FtsB